MDSASWSGVPIGICEIVWFMVAKGKRFSPGLSECVLAGMCGRISPGLGELDAFSRKKGTYQAAMTIRRLRD